MKLPDLRLSRHITIKSLTVQARERELKSKMRLEELKQMPYLEYLKSPEWQARRKRVLQEAGYKCQICNGQGKLNVHHRTYERRGNEKYRDLLVLCESCHHKFHQELKT